MIDPHKKIESALFEFRKMKAFLGTGITIRIENVPLAPISVAQDYVNSLLLVDLISVFDLAMRHFFAFHKLKKGKKESPFTALTNAGHIYNPDYLKWYKSWRHETAHQSVRHESFKVDQAYRDMIDQFNRWGLLSAKLKFSNYHSLQQNGRVRIGARVEGIPILEYEAWSERPNSGSSMKITDLSWEDFLHGNSELATKKISNS